MLYTVTCKTNKCPNKGIEYFIPNQIEDVMCGGCKTMITPLSTGLPIPEPISPAIPGNGEE